MEEEQLGGAAPQEAGIDIEAQIQDGVAAFMQSQDPAIAVEVVTMMASMMGIAPAVDPFAEQGAAPGAAPAGPAGPPAPGAPPMARNGMKMYRAGGRIYKNGGKPDPKKKTATTELSASKTKTRSTFQSQDMNSGKVQNRETTPELGKALRERKSKTEARTRVQALGKAGKDISKGGGKRIGNVAAYDAGRGKMELAGKFTDFSYEVPGFKQDLPHLDVPIAKPRPKDPEPAKATPAKSKSKPAKLKPMRVVAGGSDKKGNPANKSGVGRTSGSKFSRVQSFKKNRNR